MISYLILIPILASFLITLFMTPLWISKAKQIGLIWADMNKIAAEKVAGSGGVGVIVGFVISIMIYIAYRTFYLQTNLFLIEILAILVVVLSSFIVGFIDDLLGWQHGGLSKTSRLILIAFSAIPLVVINAGDSTFSFPFLGVINAGWLYPLIIIPIGIIGATTTFNFLAGFNGLEAGQGILILSALSAVSYSMGNAWLSVILICLAVSLLAFILFNFYPAKVFPGDALTYPVGALIATAAILGNFEKIAVFFFIPYIIEVILKVRGKLVKQSFGLPQKDGTLMLRYPKIYGLEHLAIHLLNKSGIKATEKKVVYLIWIFQLLIILIGFVIFKKGIFL